MDYTMQPEASDMEAEAVAVNNQGTGLGLNSPSPTNSKPTYASMAAKNTVQDPRVGFGYRFESDTVEVLDEDCIIDETGEFPTIKFSDRVHDQIDKIRRRKGLLGGLNRKVMDDLRKLPNSSTLEQIVFHNGETSITSDYLASLTDTTVRLYYDK
ncbi:hypothetical protein F3Y22_tig00110294pilonHSYRG00004 [Hibiscus syriacus]|uniref:Uncharacterized protein n=1 Tax=Hibiscus syriacus TaxID=106335 RepID=A0A6A3B578_HIBSY|nr:hypothetical protein F3Y22_tig00110294pilonHSYRG00004 [Hibiscus syriacus]